MSLNMKTLTQAFAKASAVIEKTVQTTVQEVTGLPKPLQEYDLADQIGSAGPGLAWKLFSARSRDGHAVYPNVCVWVLDKRVLSEARQRAGLSKAAEDSFLDIIRADATRLVRLRHPGVVHVVSALDESKHAMAMVTEPLFASAANALGDLENIENVPKELKGMEMGILEVKHGLLQIAETLDFLHNNARLIHRSISPESILITSNGAWKLGGFGFTITTDQSTSDSSNVQAFHYAEYDVEDSILPLQPALDYTAPELVRSKSSSIGTAADIFSFACLAYHLVARKPLFNCHNNVKMYMNSLTYLTSDAFSTITPDLVPDLQKMLSSNEALRPTALDFTASPFFRDDTRLRALRFLDHMLERDNMQKSEFLKALSDMWKDFDSRVLRYKVLPPLCAELRNMVMQPMILPMVLTIAESQDKKDFELSTLPALVPVLSSASGETLLLLVKHSELIINKASQAHLISHVLPMLVRAYDDTDARMQEEVLKKTVSLAKQLQVQLVKQAILPRVHGLALKTTVAAVRVNALLCLGDMVHLLDKPAVLEVLQTIQRCTAVDHSPPTLMCTLGVANSVLKQYGVEFAAEHVLPFLIPLLLAQQLNVQQFAKYMHFVKDVLRKIEEKRGVVLSDSGISEVRAAPAANGAVTGQPNKTPTSVSSAMKHSPSWDEDWIAPRQSSTSNQSSGVKASTQPTISSQNVQGTSAYSQPSMMSTMMSSQQTSSTVPAVDVEWPPRTAQLDLPIQSASTGGPSENNPQSDSGLGDIDPFADWPPRPSSSIAASGISNNGAMSLSASKHGYSYTPAPANGSSFQSAGNTSWAFNTQNSTEPLRINIGNPVSNFSGPNVGALNAQNSLGFMRQNQGVANEKKSDLGSIFAPSKTDHAAPRLAPPPLTAVGRGRGRGRGNQGQLGATSSSRPIHARSQSEQPPLLDLL